MVTHSRDEVARQMGDERIREQTAKEQERALKAQRAAPKRRVRLSTAYRQLVKAAVIGGAPAEFKDVPAGEPVEVTEDEFKRLEQLGVVAQGNVKDDDQQSRMSPAELGQQQRSVQPAAIPGQQHPATGNAALSPADTTAAERSQK